MNQTKAMLNWMIRVSILLVGVTIIALQSPATLWVWRLGIIITTTASEMAANTLVIGASLAVGCAANALHVGISALLGET